MSNGPLLLSPPFPPIPLLLPPPLQSHNHSRFFFCPPHTSFRILFSLCRADLSLFLWLSAGDPEFSSNMTSQQGLLLVLSLSRLTVFSLPSSPPSVLLQPAFVLPHIKWEGQRVGTCSSELCWVEALIRREAKKGRWQTVRAHPQLPSDVNCSSIP